MAGDPLAVLKVVLEAETSKYTKGLDQINGKMDRFARKQQKSLDSIKAGFVALAGAVTVGAFSNFVKSAANAADHLGKMSDRLGVTVEGLSRLQYAAELTGVSSRTLEMGLQRMTRRIAEAGQGTGEAVKALDELGLSAKSLNQLRPEQQFSVLADAIESVEAPADRVRIAMKLFDSEGVALLQTMKGGSAQLNEFAKQADDLGITMSEGAVKAATEFNDNLTVMGAITRGLGNKIAAQLLPELRNLSAAYIDIATDSNTVETASALLVGTFKTLTSIGVGVATVFRVVGDRLAALAAAAVSAAQGDFKVALGILEASTEDFEATIERSADRLNKIWAESATQSRNTVKEYSQMLNKIRGASNAGPGSSGSDYQAEIERQKKQFDAIEAAADKKLARRNAKAAQERRELAAERDRRLQEVDSLRVSLLSEERAILESYQRRAKIIENAKRDGLISAGRYEQLNAASTAKLEKEKTDVALAQMDARLAGTKEMFGNLAFLANNENNKLAEIGRAAAIVQVTIDGAVAAMKAYAQGGPIAGPALAATIAAVTAANIATIAGARATGGPVSGGSTYLVGEKGPELFTPRASGNIIPNNKMGGVNVTIIEDASRAGQVRQNSQGDIEIAVATALREVESQVSSGRGISKAFERRYGLTRRAS